METHENDAFIERRDSMSRDLAKAMDETWLKTRKVDFAILVHEFKLVEAEFIHRAGDNAFYLIETKRRVAETILREAILDKQPFDACRQLWNELRQLGFRTIETECYNTCTYVDCCLLNKQAELGIHVLQPLLDEINRRLLNPDIDENEAEFYREQLEMLDARMSKLQAQRT